MLLLIIKGIFMTVSCCSIKSRIIFRAKKQISKKFFLNWNHCFQEPRRTKRRLRCWWATRRTWCSRSSRRWRRRRRPPSRSGLTRASSSSGSESNLGTNTNQFIKPSRSKHKWRHQSKSSPRRHSRAVHQESAKI